MRRTPLTINIANSRGQAKTAFLLIEHGAVLSEGDEVCIAIVIAIYLLS